MTNKEKNRFKQKMNRKKKQSPSNSDAEMVTLPWFQIFVISLVGNSKTTLRNFRYNFSSLRSLNRYGSRSEGSWTTTGNLYQDILRTVIKIVSKKCN